MARLIKIRRKHYFRINSGVFVTAQLSLMSQLVLAQTDSLHQTITDFVTHEVVLFAHTINTNDYKIDVKPIKAPRQCDKPVELKLSNPEKPIGRLSISVECHDEQYWKIRTQATVDIYANLLVAKQNLERGKTLSSQDFSLKRTKLIARRLDYFTDPQTITGYSTRKKIVAGTVLTSRMLDAPLLIKRDDIVSIVAKSTVLTATTQGIALEDGKESESINIRNLSSGKIIRAKVINKHTVETHF